MNDAPAPTGFAGRLAGAFIDSKLTPLAVIASLLLGLFAIILLPREEEPQIKVPMIDVMVAMPGATAAEVENRVTRPMEKLLWEILDVEYLYSTVSPGGNLSVVRFKVGTDLETALVRINQKLQANLDRIPLGATPPLIKPRSIDDVPILALTLHSSRYTHGELRRVAAQLEESVKQVPAVAETTLIGGQRRSVRVHVDPARLAARQLSALQVAGALQAANLQGQAGALASDNREILVQIGRYLSTAKDLGEIVVGAPAGRPIYLRDVAELTEEGEDPANYVLFGRPGLPNEEAAVTLSVAKRPGANAIDVVKAVEAQIDALRGHAIPHDVTVTVTRDYGATAAEKSNELLLHMGMAVFGVALLILLFLGWRESLVVLLAIPVTLGLTLLVFYLYGYTLNRITLFALIFSIGILVDDAIVVVENIVRHQALAQGRGRSFRDVALAAVDEVGNPTLLATWAVIAAVLPMAFVSGMMGPYMRPIPIGSSAAMLFSVVVAFAVTPWAAYKVLARRSGGHAATPDHGGDGLPTSGPAALYGRFMRPLLERPRRALAFLAIVGVATAGSLALVGLGGVKVKMLPFDNKSELQVILNLPEGTTLEQTTRVAREIAQVVRREPEVRDYQVYAGTASPFNFNGLVRHYFMRAGSNVADLQVNLVPKEERSAQSHDIAKRLRPKIEAVAQRYGAAVALAEVPPGPPVLQTLVAEIYGPSEASRLKLAESVRDIFRQTPGVVDLDWYVEDQQPQQTVVIDHTKAAQHGISEATIQRTLQLALRGAPVTLLHAPDEREDIPVIISLPRRDRASLDQVLNLSVRSDYAPQAPLVPLRELVRIEAETSERFIYHKNLQNVTYVTADVAGVVESPVYAIFHMNRALAGLDGRQYGGSAARVEVLNSTQPQNTLAPAIKWDGEWHVTIEVFRDLGLAFGAVCILIYMLMVGWFKNYVTPVVVMTVIPFSLIGILPAHAAMGAFFTATSMIGFMAGAGIVVRNSIILVDFIELRVAEGHGLIDACIEAGAVRFRPMMLTALAVVVGGLVILADPIFQGLAISLLFGAVASLLISPIAVPLLYFLTHHSSHTTSAKQT